MHYYSLKHKKNYRLTIRNNSIKLIKEEGLIHNSNYLEQKIERQFPDHKRLKYCHECEISKW